MQLPILSILNKLPYMIIFSLIICIVIKVVQYCRKKKCKLYKYVLIFIFITYIQAVYEVSFGISGGIIYSLERHKPNLIPFVDLLRGYEMGTRNMLKQVVLNAILYCPLGFLLPLLSDKLKKLVAVILVSLFTSLIIEILQYYVGRSADIDDIIFNLCGATIGYFFYLILKKIGLINEG